MRGDCAYIFRPRNSRDDRVEEVESESSVYVVLNKVSPALDGGSLQIKKVWVLKEIEVRRGG